MSTESANEWILKLQGDEDLRNEVEAAGFKARQAVAKEHGFEFTHEEIKNARVQTLSDADLDAVAGGMNTAGGAVAAEQRSRTDDAITTGLVGVSASAAA